MLVHCMQSNHINCIVIKIYRGTAAVSVNEFVLMSLHFTDLIKLKFSVDSVYSSDKRDVKRLVNPIYTPRVDALYRHCEISSQEDLT